MFAQIVFNSSASPVPKERSRTLRNTNITSSITEVVGGPDWWETGSSSWNAFSTERRKKNVSKDSNEPRIRRILCASAAVLMN